MSFREWALALYYFGGAILIVLASWALWGGWACLLALGILFHVSALFDEAIRRR